ncbi:hypothetical protein [Streptomyces avicenniae]|nr:hypothetical protein [Streptomyces avicenniae]
MPLAAVGPPPGTAVSRSQVRLTYLDGRGTSAYVTPRNTGDSDDWLKPAA